LATQPRRRANGRDALISVAQAASLMGVHPNTIRTWTDAGRLPAFRINARGDRRFRRGDVDRLLGETPGWEPSRDPARRDAELAVLVRLAQGAVGASQVAICRVVIDALRTHLGYGSVAVYLGDGPNLHLEAHDGSSPAPPGLLARSEIDEEVLGTSERGDRAIHPTELRIALRAGSELLGALIVTEDEDHAPGASEVPFLRTVGSALAVALHNARLLTRARRELTRSRALRAVTQELTGQLDLSSVLDDVVDRTRGLFDADKVGLWMIGDDPEQPFQLAAARGISEAFQAFVRAMTLASPSLGVRAIAERRSFVAQNADSDANVGLMREVYERERIKTACLVPLVSNDMAVGVLGLYHIRAHEWPEEEVSLAQSFANQAAVAISNARLYRSVADQAARMRSIHDLSARLNRLTDVQAIAEAIVAEASTLAAYHDIRVYTVDWERRVCEPVAYTRRLLGEGDFRDKLRVDIGEGSFTGWVAQHGEPQLINDALNDQRGHTIEGTDDIEESMLVVPMLYEGRSVGVVALSKLGSNQFTTDDLQTMMIFAGYAAQAIANARSYERLEQQSAELARQLQSQRRLLEINERLLSTLDQQNVLEMIADGLRSVVAYDNLSIYRADHEKRVLTPVLTRELHAEQVAAYIVPFGQGLMGWAVDTAEPIMANDALNDPRAMQIPGTPPDPEALCIVPLISNDEVIGSLNISRVGNEEAYFSENDFELVKLFAGQASIALTNADRHHQVSVQAATDALTGLGNHGSFQSHLADALQRAQGAQGDAGTLALLMMDLDRFKSYNDRLGHPAGDALLQAVGRAIGGSARSEDLVYRYGGDEFALVLHGTDVTQASAVAERVRRAVARLTGSDASPVTITIGLATHPVDATTKNALIAAADTALYYGKQSGENRVVRIEEVPQEMRDLRGTLDELARTALRHPDDPGAVEHLVEHAARLSGALPDEREETVRDTLLSVARSLDAHGTGTRGHADRVGRLAHQIAERLGCDEDETRTIELAARLHGLEALGARELETIQSLRGVSEVIRGHRALTEGPIPGRRARALIPRGADVVALANAYDGLVSGTAPGGRHGRAAALAELHLTAGTLYRPEVMDALARVVGPRRTRAERRRVGEGQPVEEGAA
jgi:diguanylate cyclase (GGDEF)-like protein/excisionase family DNA binding protein